MEPLLVALIPSVFENLSIFRLTLFCLFCLGLAVLLKADKVAVLIQTLFNLRNKR
jgi:MFS-type transporter involved in bile tolerance (Atg22 family)